VGLIGSSNNPVSGLTLATLVVSALMMVIIDLRGTEGVIATLAVATVVEAFASKPVSPAERLLMLGSAIAAVSPFQLFAVAGIAIGAVLLARHLVAGRRASVQQNAAG